MVTLDSESLFNAAAAVISTIAVLVFLFGVDLGHSPVSEIALTLLFLVGVFALTQRTDDGQSILLGYGVIVVGTVALFLYVTNTFGVGNVGTVVALLAIAATLFALRTRADADNHFTSGRAATYALVVVAVLAVGVVGADVATGGLEYDLQPVEEVEITDEPRGQVPVASVTATNPTPFPEHVDPPRYEVCAAGNWSAYAPPSEPGGPERTVNVHASVDHGYNEYLFGFATEQYPVELNLNGENVTGETFSVERTDACPDEETGEPYVALFEDSQDQSPYAL